MPHRHPTAPHAVSHAEMRTEPRTLGWRDLATELTGSPQAALPSTARPNAAPPSAAPPVATGTVHVIAVDGYSGSGKTWFAERLARTLDAPVLHVDELVPGWDALAEGIVHVTEHLLLPWSQGRAARVRQYDWHAARPGGWLDLAPSPVVVVEGSGIGAVADRSLLGALVWVDTSDALRDDRLAQRDDHDLYAPYREMWAAQERALVEQARTPERADVLVLDGDETGVRLQAGPASCRPSDHT